MSTALKRSEIVMLHCLGLCMRFKNSMKRISNVVEEIRQFYKYCRKCELYFLVSVKQRLCDCCRACLRSRRRIYAYQRCKIEDENDRKEREEAQLLLPITEVVVEEEAEPPPPPILIINAVRKKEVVSSITQ